MSTLSVYGFTTLDGAGHIEALRPVVKGVRIRSVIAGGHAAIISRRPLGNWFNRSRQSALHRLRIYQRVLETIMIFAPVLPARFETLLSSEARARRFLNRYGEDLRAPVEHYGSLIQFEIAVSWSAIDAVSRLRRDGIIGLRFAENADQDEAAARALTAALEGHRQAMKERVRTTLAAMALDIIETSYPDPNSVANFTVLMRRADEGLLASLVRRLDEDTVGQLKIRRIGPLPACSFAAVEIDQVSVEDVTSARKCLKIGDTLSPQSLKKAYHDALKAQHPDINPDTVESVEELERIRSAYLVLTRLAEHHKAGADREDVTPPEAIPLTERVVENNFSMRLRRMDGVLTEAA